MAYDKVTARQTDVLAMWNGYPEPPSPPMMTWLREDQSWTFIEAATWVGSKGQDLPSQQVKDERLREKGAFELFRALFPQRGLVATGLNRRHLREPIPAEYWERATTDPHRSRDQHLAAFSDEADQSRGGQLTPVGEESPRWFGIRLERDAMYAAFPEIAPPSKAAASPGGAKVPPTQEPLRLEATCEALRELFPDGIPKGLTAKDRLRRINGWHDRNGSSQVSASTVRRAMHIVFGSQR